MIVQINSLANPKELGVEAYSQWLRGLTTQLLQILPQAHVYQPECDIDTLANQILIVQDTFSSGEGGHMKTITRHLVQLITQARRRNITFLLLEPNSKHNWFIDCTSQIRCDSIDTFVSLVHLVRKS